MTIEHAMGRDDEPSVENALPPFGELTALAAALGAAPERQLDTQLGDGVIFHLGPDRSTRLELYPQVVRLSCPPVQLAIPRTDITLTPTGVVFTQTETFHLAVSAAGEIVFQAPASVSAPELPAEPGDLRDHPHPQSAALPPLSAPSGPSQAPSQMPPPPSKEDATKSERYIGRLGAVTTHTTRAGKLVAEVALTVDDPDHPGASRLVTFVAFDAQAEALRDTYQPGDLVTAVGIAHELTRRARDGRAWTERQLYLVQLPKRHE